MKTVLAMCALLLAAPSLAAPPVHDPAGLLDRLTGDWLLTGTIAGQEVVHDVRTEWVLERQYVRIHEVSRELDEAGRPQYEAIVLITWESGPGRYVCLWLDSTGNSGLSNGILGLAEAEGDEIPFLFADPAGGDPFHNTFSYDRAADAWRWRLDAEKDGALVPFARVRLERK